MGITIEPGRDADVDDASDVFVRSNTVRRRGRPIPDARARQVARTLRDPTTWFCLARDAGVPVGMAAAMPSRGDHGRGPLRPAVCYLDLIFVVPERWGEGVGGRLLDAVVQEARRRGDAIIHLWTHDDNERSHRLYSSRGFVPSGQQRPAAAGGPTSEWELALPPRAPLG